MWNGRNIAFSLEFELLVCITCLQVYITWASWLLLGKPIFCVWGVCPVKQHVQTFSFLFFCPKGKGKPWHLLTCKDYVALAVTDWLASCQEIFLVCVLCSDRAMALLISTSPPRRRGHPFVRLLLEPGKHISTRRPELARTCLSLPADSDDVLANVNLHQYSCFTGKSSFGRCRVTHLKEGWHQFEEDCILREAP